MRIKVMKVVLAVGLLSAGCTPGGPGTNGLGLFVSGLGVLQNGNSGFPGQSGGSGPGSGSTQNSLNLQVTGPSTVAEGCNADYTLQLNTAISEPLSLEVEMEDPLALQGNTPPEDIQPETFDTPQTLTLDTVDNPASTEDLETGFVVTYEEQEVRKSLTLVNIDTVQKDLSAGQGPNFEGRPAALAYKQRGWIFNVVQNNGAGGELGLNRCREDGANCIYSSLSAGIPEKHGALALDPVNSQIYVSSIRESDGALRLYVCNPETLNCNTPDVNGALGGNNLERPSLTVVPEKNQLVIAALNTSQSDKLSLLSCDLAGQNCVHRVPGNSQSGKDPEIIYDVAVDRFLIVTRRSGGLLIIFDDEPNLFVCDGTLNTCDEKDLNDNSGQPFTIDNGFEPTIIQDPASGSLYIAARGMALGLTNEITLFKCNRDGSSCDSRKVSSGLHSGYAPAMALDPIRDEFYITSENRGITTLNHKLSFFRCDLSNFSAGCSHRDLTNESSAGNDSGYWPVSFLDSGSLRLLTVTRDANNNDRPALTSVFLGCLN